MPHDRVPPAPDPTFDNGPQEPKEPNGTLGLLVLLLALLAGILLGIAVR